MKTLALVNNKGGVEKTAPTGKRAARMPGCAVWPSQSCWN